MIAIVNVSENWGIGLENRLLFHISADLKRFRELTLGKTVIYGRKTLETFPNMQPLKGRKNMILSTDPNFSAEGAEAFPSVEALLDAVKMLPPDDVFVIGGASVYEALLPYCSAVHVTKTEKSCPADCFFPNLDRMPQWSVESCSELYEDNGIHFRYIDYVNLGR